MRRQYSRQNDLAINRSIHEPINLMAAEAAVAALVWLAAKLAAKKASRLLEERSKTIKDTVGPTLAAGGSETTKPEK